MKRSWILVCTAAVVVILDVWIKTVALNRFDSLVHKNSGILFNIPLPLILIIPITIALGAILLFLAFQQSRTSLFLIALGGAGNLYDRLIHGFTVDYLFLPVGLAFNLSDLIIVIGILWFLFGKTSTPAIDGNKKY